LNNIPIPDKIPELDIAIKAAQEAGDAILEFIKKITIHSQKLMIHQLQMQI